MKLEVNETMEYEEGEDSIMHGSTTSEQLESAMKVAKQKATAKANINNSIKKLQEELRKKQREQESLEKEAERSSKRAKELQQQIEAKAEDAKKKAEEAKKKAEVKKKASSNPDNLDTKDETIRPIHQYRFLVF